MRRTRGFTLLEILVALTLLALLLSAVLPALQTGMNALRTGDDRLRALLLARSLLVEHSVDGDETPSLDIPLAGNEPLAWRVERTPYEEEDELGSIDPEATLKLVRVTAIVTYDGDDEVRLSTLSLEREARR